MSVNAKSYRAPVEVTFTFPESIQSEIGYISITLRELMPSAEAKAISRAGTDGGVLIQEMVKESLVRAQSVDGTMLEITTADDSIDRIMTAVGPKGRTLLMAAYTKLNQPGVSDTQGFLESATASVR